MITREDVVKKLRGYLQGDLDLEALVDWAENILMSDESLAAADADVLREVIGRLGLSDVRQFGLSWTDVESVLHRLGYHAHVTIETV